MILDNVDIRMSIVRLKKSRFIWNQFTAAKNRARKDERKGESRATKVVKLLESLRGVEQKRN